MHRRFSSIIKSSPLNEASSSFTDDQDSESKVATIVKEDVLTPPSLKIKRVDNYYSRWYKGWKYRNTSAKVTVESIPLLKSGDNDPWKDFSFVVVRKIPRQETFEPTFKIVIKSEYILKACKDVIKSWPGISWNSDPLELEPETFLTFYDEVIEYRDALLAKKPAKATLDAYVCSTVTLLLDTLAFDYKNTIRTITLLKTHAEITWDLLYAIFVPRSIIVTRCAITGVPRLFKLESFTVAAIEGKRCYQLNCISMDLIDRPVTQSVGVSKVSTQILIKFFRGTVKIDTLDAYPIRFHCDAPKLRELVRERGKKWVGLNGVHYKQFNGIAALKCGGDQHNRLLRHNVKGRIMVDRASFRRFNPNYKYPVAAAPSEGEVQQELDDWGNIVEPSTPVAPQDGYANGVLVQSHATDDDVAEDVELSEEELLITPTVVYGFSLSDKLWLEFDVEKISDVEWNSDAFVNLVLPADRKDLLQSLVEAHHRELGFDDFIKGKGHGLVINLFGPPGVGKTFSAEATSEHVKRPLYLIGAGDLGTDANSLDSALERVFEVATTWKAIVLIDEADVFLEERSLHDLVRNAMVAVFLRHVEYYRGILFLTTNRVKAFDEAFLSRIHVALHFPELPMDSRRTVWNAFISKAGAKDTITSQDVEQLAMRDINGRQIKNAARTAQSLAVGRGEKLAIRHFLLTLDAMDDFTQEFSQINARTMYS